jgi:hypothetical protein
VTKIEAAQRQLDCAINLFLADGDSLAIHTLAHAAFKVLFDVYPKRRTDDFGEKLRADMGWQHLNRVPNFVKHADKDSEAALHDAETRTASRNRILRMRSSHPPRYSFLFSDFFHRRAMTVFVPAPFGARLN